MILVLVGAVVLLWPLFSRIYVDWLWFGEVGQRRVYWTIFNSRLMLGLVFGVSLTALTYVNLLIARKLAPRRTARMGVPDWQRRVEVVARQGLALLLLAGSAAIGVMGGAVASGKWDTWLRFRHGEPLGVLDPAFKQDVGFYLFQYPFLHFGAEWMFGVLLLVAAATAAVYYMDGALQFDQGQVEVSPGARAHLSVLLGLAFLVRAWEFRLERFALVLKPSGVLFGAGYSDMHARVPALDILTVVCVIAAVGFLLNVRLRALWLPVAAVALMVVTGFTVGTLYPAMIQRFQVAPNEQARERPYIQRHLDGTRRAYGLEAILPAEYNPGRPLGRADLTAERQTLDNIRLWDYRWLAQTYHGLQRLRDYYHVSEVDIDRYVVDGKYRQVMLAPREFVTERLDQQQRRWVNETLQFTHGYGLVMSAVNEADPSGAPVWLIQNLPLETAPGLEVTRPQLYYGAQDQPPIIAPSDTAEFDHPVGADSASSRYSGSGGIPLRSSWLRMLFGAALGSANIIISNQVQPDSRILLRRQIQQRVEAVAPFLAFDADPYLTIQDGKLVWVLDAYTLAETYPYSEPTRLAETRLRKAGTADDGTAAGSFNYLRNSVKATVDGYTGEVTLYAMDDAEPVLKAYRRAFPGLFRSADSMSPSLRAHLRYPEDLFRLQARKLGRFHVTSPDVFYSRSDLWEIPGERIEGAEGSGTVTMEPYYVITRLPGQAQEEFSLIIPFRTRSGTTMAAWLAARCDPQNYGELRLYRFPTSSRIDAPEQVDNAIFSDPEISRETTLLGQRGSAVRFGNMLVLPVGQSILYVKPFYVEGAEQGESGGIPLLKQVILAEKRGRELKVVMRPTLTAALSALTGEAVESEPPPPRERPAAGAPPRPAGAGVAALAAEAEAAFNAAESAQRSGNWAEYGRQLDRARAAIKRLREGAR